MRLKSFVSSYKLSGSFPNHVSSSAISFSSYYWFKVEREEYANKYCGNTEWMRCVQLKMKDKEKINPFGNLATVPVMVHWKSRRETFKTEVSSWSAQMQTCVFKYINSFLL